MSTDSDGVRSGGRFQMLRYTTTWVILLVLGIGLGGAAWIFIYAFSTPGSHWSYVAVGMLTALAAALAGSLAGFLIGAPSRSYLTSLAASGRALPSSPTQSPGSNLTEISDWLVKLLVGAGLVSLSHLGVPIGKLIDDVAGGLHGVTADPAGIHAAKVTAATIMITFGILGLFIGYLMTTMWTERKTERIAAQAWTNEGP